MDVKAATAGVIDRIDQIAEGATPLEILITASSLLKPIVGYDACALTATDPDTLLPSTAAHIAGLPAWSCGPYWDAEYLQPDVAPFESLHRTGGYATTLHRVTDGRPGRSRRHREIYSSVSLDAELRATFSLGSSCYGMLDLIRGEGEPDFSDSELAVIDAVTPAVARRLRSGAVVSVPTSDPLPTDAAVILLDEDGGILSMTPEAQATLALLPEALNVGTSSALFLNAIVHAIWARARFLAGGFEAPPATARVALTDGRRMTLRGTCTRTPDGHMGHTVLVLEPTSAPDMAPLVMAAHELTDREAEVVAMLLRGDSAQQISSRLQISIHTVRTHIKNIHEKVGVSSRAELTRLFIDQQFLPTADLTLADGPSHR